jgi:hypothetical protein
MQQLADMTIELETRSDDEGARVPLAGDECIRGRSRAGGGVKEKVHPLTGNKLGLLGMDQKQEATVMVTDGGDQANDSCSLLGM